MRNLGLWFLFVACSGERSAARADAAIPAEDGLPEYGGWVMEAEPQREGDPRKGRHALLNHPYVPCGLPERVFQAAQKAGYFGGETIAERLGKNASLPHAFTSYTTPAGVSLVVQNCLTCHAGRIRGELVIGLGAADADFTRDNKSLTGFANLLVTDPKEKAELDKFADRVRAIGDYARLDTVGVNPADTFTAVLFAHHDVNTLAWSNEPFFSVPPPDVVPVDVPPFWHMKKKNAMFYTGAGRGDQARIMMTASVLCTTSVEEARAIDEYFPDVRAFVASIVPPKYPYFIDTAKAESGRHVFEKTCSTCHGTYGENPTYPNRVIPLPVVGTDRRLASEASQYSAAYAEWFGKSFFGERARLQGEAGYVAPPLDGIWATAPYFHNGSVPTLMEVLDSNARPAFWRRSFDSRDYDAEKVGWKYENPGHGKAGETDPDRKKRLYDTTRPGYTNTGHPFGDHLAEEDRAAVVEYLKTL